MDITVDFQYSVAMNVNTIQNDFSNGITWGKSFYNFVLILRHGLSKWPGLTLNVILLPQPFSAGITRICTSGTAPFDLLLHVS